MLGGMAAPLRVHGPKSNREAARVLALPGLDMERGRRAPTERLATPAPPPSDSPYPERLIKLIPAEVIAIYRSHRYLPVRHRRHPRRPGRRDGRLGRNLPRTRRHRQGFHDPRRGAAPSPAMASGDHLGPLVRHLDLHDARPPTRLRPSTAVCRIADHSGLDVPHTVRLQTRISDLAMVLLPIRVVATP